MSAARNPRFRAADTICVEELSIAAARLLEPEFRRSGARNGRLSIQTDPRLHRDETELVEQAV